MQRRDYTLNLSGLNFQVTDWGEESAWPVVMLHGIRGYAETFVGVAQALQPGVRVIAYDQRGRGATDWDPQHNYYTDAYVEDLQAVVRTLGLLQFDLLGHSMGAGIASLVAGGLAFVWPGLTALVLVYLIGFWSILRGVLEIIGAIRLRNEIANEWTLGVAGALSVIFGLILVFMPGAGALGLLWLIATWAILFGLLMIWVAFKVRKLAKA